MAALQAANYFHYRDLGNRDTGLPSVKQVNISLHLPFLPYLAHNRWFDFQQH